MEFRKQSASLFFMSILLFIVDLPLGATGQYGFAKFVLVLSGLLFIASAVLAVISLVKKEPKTVPIILLLLMLVILWYRYVRTV